MDFFGLSVYGLLGVMFFGYVLFNAAFFALDCLLRFFAWSFHKSLAVLAGSREKEES